MSFECQVIIDVAFSSNCLMDYYLWKKINELLDRKALLVDFRHIRFCHDYHQFSADNLVSLRMRSREWSCIVFQMVTLIFHLLLLGLNYLKMSILSIKTFWKLIKLLIICLFLNLHEQENIAILKLNDVLYLLVTVVVEYHSKYTTEVVDWDEETQTSGLPPRFSIQSEDIVMIRNLTAKKASQLKVLAAIKLEIGV